MKQTDYVINNKKVSYEITENGYNIYLDDTKWITQYEPYIPYSDLGLGYEESCLKLIEELNESFSKVEETEEEEEIIVEEPVQSLSETEEAIF